MKTIFYLSALLALVTTVSGYSGGRHDHRDEPRVIIYEDANFRGGSLTLYPGESIRNLKQARFDNGKLINDQISSVRIVGDVSVLFYDHPYLRGQVMRTSSRVRNLADREMPDLRIAWNDRISSLRVIGPNRRVSQSEPRRINPEPAIRKAYQEVLRRPADPAGMRYYDGLMQEQGWSDRMVRRHMAQSDEYRSATIDRVVKQAYREVLQREADPIGLANYRRQMLHGGLSERELRQALRNSSEYRQQRVALNR